MKKSLTYLFAFVALLFLTSRFCVTTTYTTPDGQKFTNRQEAEDHQVIIQATYDACAMWSEGQNPYKGECSMPYPQDENGQNQSFTVFRTIDFCPEGCDTTSFQAAVEKMNSELGNVALTAQCQMDSETKVFQGLTVDSFLADINDDDTIILGYNESVFCPDGGFITYSAFNN